MMSKFCPECGAASEGAKFCPDCGTSLVGPAAATEPSAPPAEEREVWRGSPDSVLSPVGAKSTTYVLTSQRLRVDHGLLAKKSDAIELYRVKDIRVKKSLPQRARGRGDIIVLTTDASHDDITLESVPDPDGLAETIRGLAREARDANRDFLRERL